MTGEMNHTLTTNYHYIRNKSIDILFSLHLEQIHQVSAFGFGDNTKTKLYATEKQ